MIVSNRFNNKKKSYFKLDGFKGVDYSSSALDVARNRATSMRNFINENGINKKRNGWNQQCKFTSSINGIWHFSTLEEETKLRKECLIIHEGNNIWSIDFKNETEFESPNLLSININSITDNRSYAVQNNGMLFILCGDYLVFHYKDNAWTLERVIDSNIVYVPKTTTNISYENNIDDKISTLEKPNFLSSRRINSFEGYSGSENSISYLIDTNKIDFGKVEIKVNTYDEITEKLAIKEYSANYENETMSSIAFISKDTGETVGASIEPKLGRITFSDVTLIKPFMVRNIENDTFTVEFTYLARDSDDNIIENYFQRITKCTIGAMFGVDGVNDRLFIAGNPDFPNICFNSELNNFTYFPDDATAACGSDSSIITAFSRLGDGTLAIHKNTNGSDANIYFRRGNSSVNNKGFAEERFPITAGSIGEGVITAHACRNLSGDSLILSENGVYGIILSSNVSTNERYARERSRLINSALVKHNLKDSAAIVFKNRYYLSVDSECFIADARFTFTKEGDMPDAYNYEWWHWDNVPANVWCIINNELYFGTKKGQVCKIDKEYIDRSYETIENSDMSIDVPNNGFNINKQLFYDLRESDRINVKSSTGLYCEYINELSLIGTDRLKIVNDKDSILLLDGIKVFAYDVGSSGLIQKQEYLINDISYGQKSFRLYLNDSAITPINANFKLCIKLDNKTLQIINADAQSSFFQVRNLEAEKPLKVILPYSESPGELIAQMEYRHNVIAEWFSPIYDLGSNVDSKSLHSISISLEPSVRGKLEFGYRTRRTEELMQARGISTFNFGDIDFANFSFEVNTFAINYTKPLLVRNFNYIMIKFKSDNNKAVAVNNLTLEYSILKKNKGVR